MIKRGLDNASTTLEPGQGEGSWDTSTKVLSMHIQLTAKDEEKKKGRKGGREREQEGRKEAKRENE